MMENEYNIPICSAGQVVDTYAEIYYRAYRKGELRNRPAVMLWGAPGVGKTAIAQQTSERLAEKLGYPVKVFTVLLLLRTPTDMMGLPVVSKDHEHVTWVRPAEFAELPKDEVYFLFLDELPDAAPAMQAVAYEIALQKSIAGVPLPGDPVICCAGNHKRQGILHPLANRMDNIEIRADFDSWYSWALDHDVDERVIGYLSFDRSRLHAEPERRQIAFPTPRTWEFVSRDLKLFPGEDPARLHAQISGYIGETNALEFENWCTVWKHLPSVDDILSGKAMPPEKKKADVLYALSSSLLSCASQRRNGDDPLSDTELENMCRYASQFPPDFCALFFRGLEQVEGKVRLMAMPSFIGWASASSRMI